MPFMPEMLPFCGRRFQVALRAERTCVYPPQMPFRRLRDCVTLRGVGCDGGSHGGCQLGCTIYWKEAWLRPVRGPLSAGTPAAAASPVAVGPARELPVMRDPSSGSYFCQGTDLLGATQPGEPMWRPGQYVRLLKVRTFTMRELVAMYLRPGIRKARRIVRAIDPRPKRESRDPGHVLGLQPGDWVRIKSREEIERTLDATRKHRGLPFSGAMYESCGRQMQVRARVERILNETTGKMIHVHDTVILEASICDRYLGCARGMPLLWREAWLDRSEPSGVPA
jgi:hypothetical protein